MVRLKGLISYQYGPRRAFFAASASSDIFVPATKQFQHLGIGHFGFARCHTNNRAGAVNQKCS
ncbi:hypothetical protein QF001_000602 [Paraburkholderia youngii]